jgi:hypothetical protein
MAVETVTCPLLNLRFIVALNIYCWLVATSSILYIGSSNEKVSSALFLGCHMFCFTQFIALDLFFKSLHLYFGWFGQI